MMDDPAGRLDLAEHLREPAEHPIRPDDGGKLVGRLDLRSGTAEPRYVRRAGAPSPPRPPGFCHVFTGHQHEVDGADFGRIVACDGLGQMHVAQGTGDLQAAFPDGRKVRSPCDERHVVAGTREPRSVVARQARRRRRLRFSTVTPPARSHERFHAGNDFMPGSQHRLVESLNEVNSPHVLPTQSIIVRDEQIHPRRRGACKLERIRRSNRTIPANLGESGSRAGIERQHGSAGRDRLFVAPPKLPVAGLQRLDEHLAKGERRCQQLVLSVQSCASGAPEPGPRVRAPPPGTRTGWCPRRPDSLPPLPEPAYVRIRILVHPESHCPDPCRARIGSVTRRSSLPAYSPRYQSISSPY